MNKRSQATRGADARPSYPAWIWLTGGVVLGLLLSLLVLYKDWIPHLRRDELPQPNPRATPRTDEVAPAETAKVETKPKYDFYSVLPEMEVVVPDAEIEAQAQAPAAGDQRLLLQAGSFRNAADAEQLKAQLALLGLRAQVASVTINDAIWHRVRVGPYASVRELDEAKRTLEANGIQAIALRER
jgi:cell division protein FtsN